MSVSTVWVNEEREVAAWTSAPLRLEKVVRLAAKPADVFRSLTDPDEMCRIFGWMHAVTVDNAQAEVTGGLGARRQCHFGNGMVLEEVVVGWQPPHQYVYQGVDETHPFGMRGHVGVITCTEMADGDTELRWRHYFDHSNPEAMCQQLDESLNTAIQGLLGYHTATMDNTRS